MVLTKEEAFNLTVEAYKWCRKHDAGTGSARILCSVILQCYNEKRFPVAELASIGALDKPQYEMMLGVIALRAWMEPHQTIVDGTAITEALAKKFGYIE